MNGRAIQHSLTAIAIATLLFQPAKAAMVQWPVEDGGNGHYYDLVEGIFTWSQARDNAEGNTHLGVQGHLATITSQAEADFLRSALPLPQSKIEFWLGGFQDTSAPNFSEPTDAWRWITGEPWAYANWHTDEPSNNDGSGRSENFLQTAGASGTLLRWNDATENGSVGYILEFDVASSVATVPAPSSLWICGLFCGSWMLASRNRNPLRVSPASFRRRISSGDLMDWASAAKRVKGSMSASIEAEITG